MGAIYDSISTEVTLQTILSGSTSRDDYGCTDIVHFTFYNAFPPTAYQIEVYKQFSQTFYWYLQDVICIEVCVTQYSEFTIYSVVISVYCVYIRFYFFILTFKQENLKKKCKLKLLSWDMYFNYFFKVFFTIYRFNRFSARNVFTRPCTERSKIFLVVVDPWHSYSNEPERAD